MEEIIKLFDTILKIVHYLHIIPIRMITNNINRFNIIGFSYHFFFTFAYISMMCYFGFTEADFEEKVISLNMTLTEISLFYKVLNMVLKRNDFYRILEYLNMFKSQNDEEKNMILMYAKKMRKVFYYYAFITYFCILLNMWVTLYNDDIYLPFKSWYPFDLINNTNFFWILYFYQFFGILTHASLNVFNDVFIMFLMGTIGIQLDILGLRLKKLKINSKDGSLLSVMQDYDKIIRLCKHFQSLMSSTIFIQIYLSSGVLCMSTYHLSMVYKIFII